MKLSYNHLIYHLALELMDTLLNHRSITANFSNKNQQQQLDDEIENIKNDIAVALIIRKQKRVVGNDPSPITKKRGPYDKRRHYFTDPETGKRSVMTCKHSIWWQRYIMDAQPDYPKWAKSFRS